MRTRLANLAMVLLAVGLLVGCATRHPTAKNVMGTVTGGVEAPWGVTTQMARETLESLDMEILNVRTEGDRERGMVLARADNGRQVQVDVRADGETRSTVWVRVGAFGDTEASVSIFNRIKRNAEGTSDR